MAREPTPFKQIHLTRAIKAVTGAGETVSRVEVDGGRFTIFTANDAGPAAPSASSSELNKWMSRRDARKT